MRRGLPFTVALLVLVACGVGLLASEAAFRAYLYRVYPQMFRDADPGRPATAYDVYDVSNWEFDERFGYVYPPERVIHSTRIDAGRVVNCTRIAAINRDGNIGPIVGDYGTADVKVLVFGDSWSTFHHQGRTWPGFLQEILEAKLGRKVHVVNFGRDGYGILQMFDLAVAKIPEWKPDLVIFAFISDDLTRARFWRTVVGNGDDLRVLTAVEPRRQPDLDTSADTFLVMPSATSHWCQRMVGTGGTDAVLERLIAKRRALVEHNHPRVSRVADVLTWRHSFLYNRLRRGNAFAFLRDRVPSGITRSVNPRVAYQSYANDAAFMRALDHIKTIGIPWMLFHFAFYPELKAQKEYLLGPQEQALLESLQTLSRKAALRTTDYVQMPVREPERMNAAPDNFHPSVWGMEFYANAVANALIDKGFVQGGRRQ